MNLQCTLINSQARKTRIFNEIKKPAILPTRKQLKKLRLHIDEKLEKFSKMRKREFSYAQYKEYCEYTIARVTMFNLKRSGEVASLSEDQFTNREKGMYLEYCI